MGDLTSGGISVESEFAGAALGDTRRSRRLVDVATALARNPALSFPKALGSDAALEGTYRLLGNPDVTSEGILAPHFRATAERTQGLDEVTVVHDTSAFIFGGSTREGLGHVSFSSKTLGFLAHVSLVLKPGEERLPLGVAAIRPWVRTKKKVRARPEHRTKDPERESKRWFEQVDVAESRLPSNVRAVHVMDREGDAYELFAHMESRGSAFVVRAAHDRLLEPEQRLYVSDVLTGLEVQCERVVPIASRARAAFARERRAHPARDGRLAKLNFAATRVKIRRPKYAPPELPADLELNVVHVSEIDPGEAPVEWVLFTSESIDTAEDILRIVDIYRSRWTIEEYFKALKTGCSFEERQLESLHSLTNALAIFAPIAWRLLLLRTLSRKTPDAPASLALTDTQLEVLRAVSKRPLPKNPSARDALLAIAALGGHIKNNGDPGWQVLARGYHDLLLLELGWLARAQNSDQS